MIDAENLLDHDDRSFGGARRVGAIAAQLKMIRSRQFDVFSHGSSICLGVNIVWEAREPNDMGALLPHPVVTPVALPAGQSALAELQKQPVVVVEQSAAADIADRQIDFLARTSADLSLIHI